MALPYKIATVFWRYTQITVTCQFPFVSYGFGGSRRNNTQTDDEERPDAKPDPFPVNPAPRPMNGLTVLDGPSIHHRILSELTGFIGPVVSDIEPVFKCGAPRVPDFYFRANKRYVKTTKDAQISPMTKETTIPIAKSNHGSGNGFGSAPMSLMR